MLFVSLGDNAIVNLRLVQSLDFNAEQTEVIVYWMGGKSRVYTGDQAKRLIKKVQEQMPENWTKS